MSLEAAIGRLRDENEQRVVRHKPKPLGIGGTKPSVAADDY
jgi:hypothetical protein